MNGRFVSGEASSVRAEAAEKVLSVILPPGLYGKYTIEKASTKGIPASWTDPADPSRVYQIKWVNNFNLKAKPGAKINPDAPMEYEIQFDKPDLGPVNYTRLFYYVDGTIMPFDSKDYEEIEKGSKIAARLRIGDPGIGWGGT